MTVDGDVAVTAVFFYDDVVRGKSAESIGSAIQLMRFGCFRLQRLPRTRSLCLAGEYGRLLKIGMLAERLTCEEQQ